MGSATSLIDDVVEGTLRVLDQPPTGTPPYALFNIGNHQPVPLLDYIAALERAFGRQANKEMRPMQAGDIRATFADTRALAQAVGFAPSAACPGRPSSPSGPGTTTVRLR